MKAIRNIVVFAILIFVGLAVVAALIGPTESQPASLSSPPDPTSTDPASTAGAGQAETPSQTPAPEATEDAASEDAVTKNVVSTRAPATKEAVSTRAPATKGAGLTSAPAAAEWGLVVRVADGDTLTVRFENGEDETLRLLDVDTPETVHPNLPVQCYGPEASAFTKTLKGKRVGVEDDGRDRYGRLLAYVWIDDEEGSQLLNVRLLEEGLAVYKDYGNPGQYADRSRAAAENALLGGVGLWSACEVDEKPTVVPTRSALANCPQGCLSPPDPACNIKGNVNTSSGTKIYHQDGKSASFARVNMKEGEGDLWFCTIEEAEANGFRAPGR